MISTSLLKHLARQLQQHGERVERKIEQDFMYAYRLPDLELVLEKNAGKLTIVGFTVNVLATDFFISPQGEVSYSLSDDYDIPDEDLEIFDVIDDDFVNELEKYLGWRSTLLQKFEG